MKPKPSVWFLVGAGVGGLLIAGAALLVVTSYGRVQATERQLKARREVLSGLYQADPFPSIDNVQRENENADKLRKWFVTLLDNARQGQLQLEERSPSTFMTLLGQTQRELIAGAKVPDRLPPNFALGFDQYFGEGSKLPSPEHVPRLTQQLKIIENICQVFLDENVTQIKSIHREFFEGDAPSTTDATGESAYAAVNPKAGLMEEGASYGKFHFVIELEIRESALLGVLNRLARHEIFMVVTRLKLEKQGDDVQSVERESTKLSQPKATGPGALVEEPLTREQRIVCGVAVEKAMLVTLDVDVYNFRGGDQ
ncbi:MAG: Amuc_1100 family pilus-like protein [Lentisphaerae bacterium]|nr:Amuc_1100 family pilus-like protein [Lentisphaerota bacterium]